MTDSAFEIPLDSVARWCQLIGDVNPIHIDEEIARSFGFPTTVVPGSFTSALLLDEIDRQGLGAPQVRVRLRRWTHVGEPVQFLRTADRLQLVGMDGRERASAAIEW